MELTLQPSGKLRRHRTKTFTITILGLLTKRNDLVREGRRQADIGALDRTLRVLGYEGEIASLMPAQSVSVFRNGGLRRAYLDVLEAADRPLTSREIAERVHAGKNAEHIAAATMGIAKALKADRACGNGRAKKRGRWALVWEMGRD